MANEVSLGQAAFTFFKASLMANPLTIQVPPGFTWNVNGNAFVNQTILVPTGGIAVPLGQVTAPHFSVWHNMDTNNFITVANVQGDQPFMHMGPSEFCFVSLDSSVVPWAIANTAACLLEYLIIQF
jgi:hypothetical protein